jgi:hypothetical protein
MMHQSPPDDPFDDVPPVDDELIPPDRTIDEEAAEQFLYSIELANAPVPAEPAL